MRLEPAHWVRGPIAMALPRSSAPAKMLRMAVSSGLILLPMVHRQRGPLGLAAWERCGDRVSAPLTSVSRSYSRSAKGDGLSFEPSLSISRTPLFSIRPQGQAGTRSWQDYYSKGPRNIQFGLKLYY